MPRHTSDDPNYDVVMKMFGGRCILCNRTYGVTVHELTPRSLSPRKWKEVSNRVTLCQPCHDYVHTLSRKDRDDLLLPARERALQSPL